MTKPFQPPTLEEVRAYVIQKKLFVNAERFHKYYAEACEPPWVNGNGKRVRNWKNKCWQWHWHEEDRGHKRTCCRQGCTGYGVYSQKDDTGQVTFLCERHKPKSQPIISKETAERTLKDVPHEIDTNLQRSRQRLKLAISERTARRRQRIVCQ